MLVANTKQVNLIALFFFLSKFHNDIFIVNSFGNNNFIVKIWYCDSPNAHIHSVLYFDHCHSNSIHGSGVESGVIGTRLGLSQCISKRVRWTFLLLPAEIHHSVLVCEAGMLIEVSDWAMIWKHHWNHWGRYRCWQCTCNQCEQEVFRAGQVVFKWLPLESCLCVTDCFMHKRCAMGSGYAFKIKCFSINFSLQNLTVALLVMKIEMYTRAWCPILLSFPQ